MGANAEDADASAAVDADANAYNQGSEDCIYGDHPTSLVDTAAATPEFSTLVAALNASGLVGALSDPSTKLTVFAPTNEAFDKLFSDFNVTAEEVLGNTKFLSDVLKYHVVGDVTAFGDLTDGSSLPTLLEGESLGVSTSESTATIYGAFGFPLGTQTAEAVTIIGGATNATVVRGNVGHVTLWFRSLTPSSCPSLPSPLPSKYKLEERFNDLKIYQNTCRKKDQRQQKISSTII